MYQKNVKKILICVCVYTCPMRQRRVTSAFLHKFCFLLIFIQDSRGLPKQSWIYNPDIALIMELFEIFSLFCRTVISKTCINNVSYNFIHVCLFLLLKHYRFKMEEPPRVKRKKTKLFSGILR